MNTFTLRTLRPDDAGDLLAFELDNRAWFERHIDARADDFYSLYGVRQHIAQLLQGHAQGHAHPCLIVDRDGTLMGRANLKGIGQQTAEVGYRIGQQHAGQGLATAALRHLIAVARAQWRLQRLTAHAIDGNAASIRVLERCGFVRGHGVADIAVVDGVVVDGHEFLLELVPGSRQQPSA